MRSWTPTFTIWRVFSLLAHCPFSDKAEHYTVEGRDAFAGAGLEPEQDLDGLTGRGPYLATAVNQGSDRGWPISPHALF